MNSPSDAPAPSTQPNLPSTAGRSGKQGAQVFFWTLAVVLGALATWANLDLTGHRAFLFMDEMIPFDNVKHILTAASSDALGSAIADGGDHRYGRIFYNISALIAWLPYHLAGDQGIIVAIRSTQVALLIGAMILLCITLLQGWLARAFALLAMACLPYTDYYLTQPKPEPLQLACYALFLTLALRRQFMFGWHWIFLGLAFGAKISAAPFCACAALLAVVHFWLYGVGFKKGFTKGVQAAVSFLAGWVIAIPMLAVPTRVHLDTYLNWTFRATGHGSDDTRVTALTWLRSILQGEEAVHWRFPSWIMFTLFAALGVFLLLALINLRRRRVAIQNFFETQSSWLILGFAVSLLLPIIVAVKRLWGFYLLPGQVLAIVALAGIAERWLSSVALDSSRIWRRVSWISVAALVGSMLLTASYGGKAAIREYDRLAHRTSEATYLQNLAVFRSAVEMLDALAGDTAQQNGGTLEVVYDPFLFLPNAQPGINVQVFWAATINWDAKPGAIILGRQWHLSYFLHERPLPERTAANFAELEAAVAQFATHVEPDPSAVSSKPYQLVRWFGENAAIILRKDIAEKWQKVNGPKAAPRLQP